MADSHFVGFALMPGPVRKEKQFRLPDDFSEFDFTILLFCCTILQKVVYLIRQIKITNLRFRFFAQVMAFLFSPS